MTLIGQFLKISLFTQAAIARPPPATSSPPDETYDYFNYNEDLSEYDETVATPLKPKILIDGPEFVAGFVPPSINITRPSGLTIHGKVIPKIGSVAERFTGSENLDDHLQIHSKVVIRSKIVSNQNSDPDKLATVDLIKPEFEPGSHAEKRFGNLQINEVNVKIPGVARPTSTLPTVIATTASKIEVIQQPDVNITTVNLFVAAGDSDQESVDLGDPSQNPDVADVVTEKPLDVVAVDIEEATTTEPWEDLATTALKTKSEVVPENAADTEKGGIETLANNNTDVENVIGEEVVLSSEPVATPAPIQILPGSMDVSKMILTNVGPEGIVVSDTGRIRDMDKQGNPAIIGNSSVKKDKLKQAAISGEFNDLLVDEDALSEIHEENAPDCSACETQLRFCKIMCFTEDCKSRCEPYYEECRNECGCA